MRYVRIYLASCEIEWCDREKGPEPLCCASWASFLHLQAKPISVTSRIMVNNARHSVDWWEAIHHRKKPLYPRSYITVHYSDSFSTNQGVGHPEWRAGPISLWSLENCFVRFRDSTYHILDIIYVLVSFMCTRGRSESTFCNHHYSWDWIMKICKTFERMPG